MSLIIPEMLTFDDVLLVPSYSDFVPREADVKTQLTKTITLHVPIISAAMDTVTEAEMAIAMAQCGGIGIVHKNNSIEEQCSIVRKVKRFESGVVIDPITIDENSKVSQAIALMKLHSISGLPVVNRNGLLCGIITNRDIRFIDIKQSEKITVSEIMTKNVITIKESSTKGHAAKDQAIKLFHQHKVEKLVIVDAEGKCKGLVTFKDTQKSITKDHSTKDTLGRLCVGAAIGVGDGMMERVEHLIAESVDVFVLDSAHGHSKGIIDSLKIIKTKFGNKAQIIAGNVATQEGVKALIDAGADGVKVGIGPGSICTTRIVAGVGVPQLSAIMSCSNGSSVPIIADGGMRTSGDIAKAIAAGASSVMLGNMLAGTEEAPGEVMIYEGRSYKRYRGMGSAGAMVKGSADRYSQSGITKDKLIAEGVEAMTPFKGSVSNVISQLIGGLKAAMGYTGNKTTELMRKNCKFVKITNSGLKESHPHGVVVTNEK